MALRQDRTDEDSATVRRVLAGDVSAFEDIVKRWQSALFNLAFRFCHDRQWAEEMAQDAFLQIYRQLPTFRGDSTFSTWIFAISLNVFRSALRRRSLPVVPIECVAEIAEGKVPQLEIERQECEELLRRAVLALPRRYRDALIIFYFREMNLSETAAILRVREGTAKTWLHRGREMLRRKLSGKAAAATIASEVNS